MYPDTMPGSFSVQIKVTLPERFEIIPAIMIIEILEVTLGCKENLLGSVPIEFFTR
jgi:hypothetical protein